MKEEIDLQKQIDAITEAATSLTISENIDIYTRNKQCFSIFTEIIGLATFQENLHFTTLFSQISYIGNKFHFDRETLHLCHAFRKGHEQGYIRKDSEEFFLKAGIYTCIFMLKRLFSVNIEPQEYLPDDETQTFFKRDSQKFTGYFPVIEAVIFKVDKENKTLFFYDERDAAVEQKALYDVTGTNEVFNANIESLSKTFKLPINANFIDTNVRDDGIYIPSGIIIQPDFLFDVTSIAGCFSNSGADPFLYLLSKFRQQEVSIPIVIGNLVNFILDELITNPNQSFKKLLPKLFRADPLSFATMDDDTVRKTVNDLKNHYQNLLHTIKIDFNKFNISADRIFLEPSFYSRDYGIQGRLDILHERKDGQKAYDIIELKSGKIFMPNVYGINASHYIQTLLYDLLIKSVYQTKSKSFNYILYSKEEENSLKFAPPVKQQQYEAMKLRNDLVAIEQKLQSANTDDSLIRFLKPENFGHLRGFTKTNLNDFHNIYTTLNPLEKAYFNQFTAFIAREQTLAKTGNEGIDKISGHAALWLESVEEKKDKFTILTNLTIIVNESMNDEAIIIFKRPEGDNSIVNFRVGDIGVLYAVNKENPYRSVLKNQVFKCSFIDIGQDTVTIKLRSKQNNQRFFERKVLWNIEPDHLDSGFNMMYKNLYAWAGSPLEYRSLHLGLKSPRLPSTQKNDVKTPGLTFNQNRIVNQILASKDYFLLWGPPGTGKTKVIIRELVKRLHTESQEDVLLLAYTNRAVDELCEAIVSIDDSYKSEFIRIGSRTATHSEYHSNLIHNAISELETRQEILDFLKEKRIYVSTISSIVGKPELFLLKSFDTVIIDEASQVIEPMVCGLLSRFKRFILIGDHMQLPAVVIQNSSQRKIDNDLLNKVGIVDTGMSFFERLYFRCIKNGWNHAYGILNEQGRMHAEIMAFANEHFYGNQLETLPEIKRITAPAFFQLIPKQAGWLKHRKSYFPTPTDKELNWKTNNYEAKLCAEIVQKIVVAYEENHIEITRESIGIITPYRAQIALIRKHLRFLPKDISELISIDTVERYQGGTRDIIIISFCVNKINQLDTLVSLSQEGADRKLNVALTRAKEHVILIGNEEILSQNSSYRSLLESYYNAPTI